MMSQFYRLSHVQTCQMKTWCRKWGQLICRSEKSEHRCVANLMAVFRFSPHSGFWCNQKNGFSIDYSFPSRKLSMETEMNELNLTCLEEKGFQYRRNSILYGIFVLPSIWGVQNNLLKQKFFPKWICNFDPRKPGRVEKTDTKSLKNQTCAFIVFSSNSKILSLSDGNSKMRTKIAFRLKNFRIFRREICYFWKSIKVATFLYDA